MPIHLGSWSQLQEAKALFKPSVHFQGRILFPVTLDTACRSTAEVTMGPFPKSLKLLSNHLVVAAWWAACYDALQAADDERVGKLYECAQTCTLRVSLWESNAQVMRIALESSEKHRAIATTCTIDNIVLFADRLSIIVQDCPGGTSKQLEYLKENGVLFRQKEIGRNTLTGALAIVKVLTSRSRSMLSYLEARYGRSLITESTTKLYRMFCLIKKHMAGPAFGVKVDPEDGMEMLLSMLCLGLDSTQLKPQECIGSFLTGEEGSKVTDPSCWARTAIQTLSLGQHARLLAGRMESSICSKDMCSIIETLTNPVVWRQEIMKQRQVMDVDECFDNVSVACMETLKKKAIADSGFKKMEPLLDWCYSLIDGQFQAGIAEVCKEDIVDVVSLIEKGETAHTVVKELSDALDAANEQADQAADTQQKVMPRLSWRQLARVNSDENGDGEATRLALQNEREDRIRG
ncbi:unnamed protein product, partial [Symbiodinium sp. CCMP2456]